MERFELRVEFKLILSILPEWPIWEYPARPCGVKLTPLPPRGFKFIITPLALGALEPIT